MIVVEMKKHFQERAIEWWSGSMAMLWGAYVLLNPGMFETISSAHGLLQIGPQHLWGFGAFIVGAARLVALTINGFWHRTPLIRLATSVFGVMLWFWVSAGMVMADMAQMGIVVYIWHMSADIYSSFRCAIDTYEVEAQRRLRILAAEHSLSAGEKSNVHRISR